MRYFYNLFMNKYPAIFLLITMFFPGCSGPGEQNGKTVFRYNEAANITTLDPAFARDQAIIWATNQLFNGLVQLNDNLEIMPCIAHSWEIGDSGTSYIFHLRSDVFFHDNPAFLNSTGRKVTANDFVFSLNRILDPAVASPGAWIFNWIKYENGKPAFTTLDDSTLIIKLNRPFPPFLSLLTMQYCSVVPKEALDFYKSDFRRHPVGTGPFQFKMWQEGVKLVLLKNQRYFETREGKHLPYLDAVSITFVADKQSAFLEFIKGNTDFLSGLDPAYKDELLTPDGTLQKKYSGKLHLITQNYLNTEYLGFVLNKGGPAAQKNLVRNRSVRKAINIAFDRGKMIQYLRNNIGTPGLQGITPKGLPSFDSTAIFNAYDPDRAKILLAEAGYPDGKGLDPIVLTSTADYLDICKYIQHQVQKIGINLRIEISPPAAVKEMKAMANLPFFRASWIADYPDAENYLSMFYSRNFCPKGPNYTHFSNPEFDKLYEQSLSTLNDSIRFSLYRKMDRIIMEEVPVVILYYDQVLRFTQLDIEGLGINPMNLLTLKYVTKNHLNHHRQEK